MANDLINHAGVMQPLLNPKGWACKASGLTDTCTKEMQETVALGVDVKAPPPLPAPSSGHLFHLAIPDSYHFIFIIFLMGDQWAGHPLVAFKKFF